MFKALFRELSRGEKKTYLTDWKWHANEAVQIQRSFEKKRKKNKLYWAWKEEIRGDAYKETILSELCRSMYGFSCSYCQQMMICKKIQSKDLTDQKGLRFWPIVILSVQFFSIFICADAICSMLTQSRMRIFYASIFEIFSMHYCNTQMCLEYTKRAHYELNIPTEKIVTLQFLFVFRNIKCIRLHRTLFFFLFDKWHAVYHTDISSACVTITHHIFVFTAMTSS